MKLMWILFVGCFTVNALPSNKDFSDIYKHNVPFGPCGNDSIDDEKIEFHTKDDTDTSVKFYLYTKGNPINGRRVFAENECIVNSIFNPSNPTRFIIHDYYNSYLSPLIKKLRKTWLMVGDYNVFVVDWPIARNRFFTVSELAVPSIGKSIAQFIEYMVQNHSMTLDTTHIIGYGLGAHVSGYVGKNFKSKQIHTIIGLNPSLSSSSTLTITDPSKRLNSTDAFYVETIQTEGTVLGVRYPVGKAAFYPNGGLSQPRCNDFSCSHRRAVHYYAESIIRNNFAAIQCKSFQDLVDNNCGWTYSSIRMGGKNKNTFMVSGVFYVPVNDSPPYGILP